MEFMLHSAFAEVATLLMLAAVIGFAGLLLRQPLIVSFIAVGDCCRALGAGYRPCRGPD